MVHAVKWNDSQLLLAVEAGTALHFFIREELIEWALPNRVRMQELAPLLSSDPERICELYVNGSRHFRSDLDRWMLAEWLCRKTIRRVVTDEFGVYLHFVGTAEYLALHPRIIVNSGETFLSWVRDSD